jgi:hypothetical protein
VRALFLATAAVALFVSSAEAQTIRPLVAEYQRQARGRFEVVNNSDRPLNVVVEPRGFTVGEDGRVSDAPLPTDVRVNLSDMSFRLPARQSRWVFYEATSGRFPAWFVLYANITGFPARDFNHVNVQLELPHIVYLLPKEGWSDGDLRIVDVDLHYGTNTLSLVVENRGAHFGRVAAVKVRGAFHRVDLPGFPLFPGGRRRLQMQWKADEEPSLVTVDARTFSFEQRLNRVGR